MISSAPTRFTIEDENAIKPDNFVNKIFDTTTVNNTENGSDLGSALVDNYNSIQSKKPVKILNSIRGVSGKTYELDRHDLLEVMESLFEEDSSIFQALSSVVNGIDSAEMAILNGFIKASNILDKVTGALCNLAALLLGLTLALPLIRLLDALLGLILIAATKCQYLIYTLIMSKIDSDILKRMLSIRLIHGALESGENSLLTEILNHPSNANLASEASWLPGLVVGTVGNSELIKGTNKKFIPLPYPEWYEDMYNGVYNIDPAYNKPPKGTLDINGNPVEVVTSGPFWELSPIKYSPSYVKYARQFRTELKIVEIEPDPGKIKGISIATLHAIMFKDVPDTTVKY